MKNISIREMVLVSFFAGLTGILAYIKIPLPFTPVPITAQTLGVMLSGIILGSKLGFISQIIYLLLGIIGLPIFSGGSAGLGMITSHTGGYLWSFPIAAYIMGFLVEKKRSFDVRWLFLVSIIGGIIAIYFFGLIQFSLVLQRSLIESFMLAAAPFLLGDFLKALLAAILGSRLGKAIRPYGKNHDL